MLSQLKGLTELSGTKIAHIEGFQSFQALSEEERLEIMAANVACDHETNTLSIRFGSRERPLVSPEFLLAIAEHIAKAYG
jgi:hypothetical protein